jgi:hypothetical protein
MNISIQFPEVTVQVEACDTDQVADLKKKMSFFSEDQELLTYNGSVLADDLLLGSLGIRDGSIISVISKAKSIITKRRSWIASAMYAVGGGCRDVVQGFTLMIPSFMTCTGLILSAAIISSGMVIAARTYAENRQNVPSKDEIKHIVKEITEGAISGLSVDNYRGATAMFQDLFKHVCKTASSAGQHVRVLLWH